MPYHSSLTLRAHPFSWFYLSGEPAETASCSARVESNGVRWQAPQEHAHGQRAAGGPGN